MYKLLVFLSAIFVTQFSYSAQRDFDLVCPCDVELVSDGLAKVSFGLTRIYENFDINRVEVYLSKSDSDAYDTGIYASWQTKLEDLPDINSSKNYDVDLPVRSTSSIYLNTYMEISFYSGDEFKFSLRRKLESNLNKSINYGYSRTGSLVFISRPEASLNGNNLEISIPMIKNLSTEIAQKFHIIIAQQNTSEGRFYRLNEFEVPNQLNSGDNTNSFEVSAELIPEFKDTHSDIVIHVVRLDGNNAISDWLITDYILSIKEPQKIQENYYQTSSIRFFKDSNKDGISDYNENYFNLDNKFPASINNWEVNVGFVTTDEAQSNSSNIDAYAEHIINHSNNIFENSGIKATLKLSTLVTVGGVESTPISSDDENNQISLLTSFQGPFEKAKDLYEDNKTDVIVAISQSDGKFCGVANGFSVFDRNTFDAINMAKVGKFNFAVIGADCPDSTLAHEFGHIAGLGHSRNQMEVGIRPFSVGHGINSKFVTIMPYQEFYDNAVEIELFSNPKLNDCSNYACGIDLTNINGADAVFTLNQTIPHIAAIKNGNTPIISLIGEQKVSIPKNNKYKESGATAYDIEDGIITNQIKVTGNVDTSVNGSYEIEYSVSDSNGNTSTITRIVTVENDADGDGVNNSNDDDIDGDGYINDGDIFPYDSLEWFDSDGDGVGDNADDTYNPSSTAQFDYLNRMHECSNADDFIEIEIDGHLSLKIPRNSALRTKLSIGKHVIRIFKNYSLVSTEVLNFSSTIKWKGWGCNWDSFNYDSDISNYTIIQDDDLDGYINDGDIFPDNSSEWFDTDGDGIGDNKDQKLNTENITETYYLVNRMDKCTPPFNDHSVHFILDGKKTSLLKPKSILKINLAIGSHVLEIYRDGVYQKTMLLAVGNGSSNYEGWGCNWDNTDLNKLLTTYTVYYDSNGDGVFDESGNGNSNDSFYVINGTNIILIKAILDAQEAKLAQ